MPRFFALICLLLSNDLLWAQNIEPCNSNELQAEFDEQRQIEYERHDDSISIIVTVPVELPDVSIGGIFLVREEGGKRIVYAPIVQFSDKPRFKWTAVSLGRDVAHQYAIAVSYHLVQTYPDACWYEFKIQIESQNSAT